MLHITCDLCGKEVSADDSLRYILKMEVYASHDPSTITDSDLDEDHLETVAEILREGDNGLADQQEIAPAYKKLRFDLCPGCHRKFLRDPLGKETAPKFDFSKN